MDPNPPGMIAERIAQLPEKDTAFEDLVAALLAGDEVFGKGCRSDVTHRPAVGADGGRDILVTVSGELPY